MSRWSKRSGEAQAALGRRAPVMKHRLEPRGGQKNEQADLVDEVAQAYGDYRCEKCCDTGCVLLDPPPVDPQTEGDLLTNCPNCAAVG